MYLEHGDSCGDLLVVFSEVTNVGASNEDVVLVGPEELLDISDVDGVRIACGIVGHDHLWEFED